MIYPCIYLEEGESPLINDFNVLCKHFNSAKTKSLKDKGTVILSKQ
jgi:hypothetical protein